MIKLIRFNVERIVETEAEKKALEAEGYTLVEDKKKPAKKAEEKTEEE